MLLKVKNLSKQFANIHALKDISLEIDSGEIHGLVGENGAGKSTLIKILTGVYKSDSGQIYWQGKKITINSPKESQKIGINVIHQDRHLIPAFNGIENIYLGSDYETKLGLVINWSKMQKKAVNLMGELGFPVPLNTPASDLTPPEKTFIEIIRAIMSQCKLLILDEPTASLTDKEAEKLFNTITKLKTKGTAILYVSHRIEEIFRLTDKVTILKNGRLINTLNTKDTNKEEIISLMTDNWKSEVNTTKNNTGKVLLSVKNMASKDKKVLKGTFQVKSGEILGIFGLSGSGRTELLECIYGLRPTKDGTVILNGQELNERNPSLAIKKGMVLICEDRREMGLIGNLSVKENIVLSTINHYAKYGIIHKGKEIEDARKMVKFLAIKTTGTRQPVKQLSGGNQQKVVFAKALMSNPQVILCNEPTQAVDVKTRSQIHKLLREKAREGKAIVFVSSDLKEVLEIADSVLVMAGGYTKECLKNDNLTTEQILKYCYSENQEKRGY